MEQKTRWLSAYELRSEEWPVRVTSWRKFVTDPPIQGEEGDEVFK